MKHNVVSHSCSPRPAPQRNQSTKHSMIQILSEYIDASVLRWQDFNDLMVLRNELKIDLKNVVLKVNIYNH